MTTENLCIKYVDQQGVALVTALLYLLVVTSLVVFAFSSSVLQTKISEHLYQDTQAFENAESALLMGEQAIVISQIQGQGEIDANTKYQFHQLSRPECGLFYQVDAVGMVVAAKIQLQSIFIFPLAGLNPCMSMSSGPHRVVWRQLG